MVPVYIAGPMTGIPQFNFPAFDEAARDLRARGYTVVTPCELDDGETREASLASETGDLDTAGTHNGQTWGDFLARDIKLLVDGGIGCVLVLEGWEESRGACLETFVASAMMGLPVFRYRGEDAFFKLVPRSELHRAWTRHG